MRAFIGVDFPQEIKDRLIEIQNFIKLNSSAGRWKYIGNFHLTLKFLGEVTNTQTDRIFESMKDRLSLQEAFKIKVGELGYFNGDRCLRVIYLKVHDEDGRLAELHKSVDSCLSMAGIESERRKFTPHITLAQDVKLNCPFADLNMGKMKQMMEINIDKLSIVKSEQIEGKRIYTPVRSIKFI